MSLTRFALPCICGACIRVPSGWSYTHQAMLAVYSSCHKQAVLMTQAYVAVNLCLCRCAMC
jgi:hypothetical protein